MARKNLLKDLMGAASDAPASPALPRPQRGAIGAVSQSIADLKARALLDVAPELIDMAGFKDRLDDDPQGIEALKASILEYGQQVPVLLRQIRDDRYEVVFGRRRVQALRELGQPVKAMVRNLSDRELVIAQGQENSARKDLSFIEKAHFAGQMAKAGYDRKAICDALSIDKTVISRMLAIIDAVPEELIQAIGAAPAAGRDRWLALAGNVRGQPLESLIAAAQGVDSNARFMSVMSRAKAPVRHEPERTLMAGDGTEIGKTRRTKSQTVIVLSGQGKAFGDWLADHITQLHRDWSDNQ